MPERGAARFNVGRHAGVLVPLFSIPTRRSWGIGEIPDLVTLARWLNHAGCDFVQFLPLNEMQEGQSSPYSALSAMALDPLFIALDDVPEWRAAGEETPGGDNRPALVQTPEAPRLDYAGVRAVKGRALRRSFDWFAGNVQGTADRRARSFRAFVKRERWWLDDYVLFRALHDEQGGRHWREWEAGLRDREVAALAAARERLERETSYYAYLQWIAGEQWQRARKEAAPVGLFGDFPFMVSANSADVWARQHEFDLDSSVGTPPDAFSASGQDWGLPAYRWDVVAAGGYVWLRDRARRAAELYDGFRIDHLIGFFRTYIRRPDGSAGFVPTGEAEQRAQGERLLGVFSESGASLIGEDLGTVPDFLRVSLAERGIPGMKVLRWERDWHAEGQPFHDVTAYPPVSVATSGTHDTETLSEWWDNADWHERQAVLSLPSMRGAGLSPDAPFSDHTRDALLETLFASGSRLLILPIQDIFGWRDRINTPASVSDRNWTWRLPGPVEDLMTDPGGLERAGFLRARSRKYGRIADHS
jgi:4-alpha-glucanotransferase